MTQGAQTTANGWLQLESSQGMPMRGEFRVFDTNLTTADGAVLLAIDAVGLRHVLVPVAADFPPAHDRRSGGVHLTTRPLVDASGQHQYLDLACQKGHLNNVFTHLAEEVLDLLRDSAIRPLQACRQTLQRWRELLDRETSTILSTEALCGLFGELWHLARMAAKGDQGLLAWQGPYGARHDFTADGCALEIKTTARRNEWKFRVHGLMQLEQPANACLYLCAMRLELNGASGSSVPDLIQMLLATGIDRRDLLDRLSKVGYDQRDETHYQQLRLAVIDWRIYEVAAPFPRLTAASLNPPGPPSGVSDIHYTIDLAASSATPLQPEILDRIHAALAGVHDASTAGPAV
ncbi:PD-(D/E)XK motif protein [Alcaligenes faecalis]|uniref:PD-(D/E)XK motif protein n=1 Tax=Alcaligenes faecalis TaxID=511 RepID=UPI000F0B45C3|nr:PD-(D/E)XK motif protein [Alcaligenes faecalis]AYR19113.1 PD-(D/E)XK motif protein [Alcaligenes faecalis]